MTSLDIVASAEIVPGKKTRRVKMRRTRRPMAKSAGAALARYRQDPDGRSGDTAIVCISMPVSVLATIDAAAERAQMSRSHFLRAAAKQFALALAPTTAATSR